MKDINIDTIRAIDRELIEQGIGLSARPFHAVIKYMNMNNIYGNIFDREIWGPIEAVYKGLYPSGEFGIGSAQVGCLRSGDQAHLIRIPIVLGTASINFKECLQMEKSELDEMFKYRPVDGWRAMYAVSDLLDFTSGRDAVCTQSVESKEMWHNCATALEATARCLLNGFAEDIAVQNSCFAAELSIKGALAHLGWSEKKRRSLSHRFEDMADALIKERHSVTDFRFRAACRLLPDYVSTRYKSHNLTRIDLIGLAMRAQYIAGEALRRVSSINYERDLETKDGAWARPAP